MNEADNEAGNRAVDSLINYETVKVRLSVSAVTIRCRNEVLSVFRKRTIRSGDVRQAFGKVRECIVEDKYQLGIAQFRSKCDIQRLIIGRYVIGC